MSAIAGLWHTSGRPGVAERCTRMLTALQIYGPHDGKMWSDDALAMGRRLYRTLPEDAFDSGPLKSTDGRLVLVADVRLDNRDEIGGELGISRAQRLSDSAILFAALERWGEGALDRIVGDFAFALWNDAARELLLARDFAGARPLYFHRSRDFFAFASMTKGLHALPDVPYGPDEQVLAEFLALVPHNGSSSFFRDIRRVEPGQAIRVTRTGISTRLYWNPRRSSGGGADYVEGLRHHLDQATRSRLRGANGAVGAHLSAGFDSASVAATAARLLAPEGGKVVAFTAVPREGYDGPAPRNRFGNEGPLAAATAALYPNMEHVLIRTGHLSPLDNLDRNFFLFELPILNLCNMVWATGINQAARERGLGILLNGQMGNMTISYDGSEWLPELLRAGRLFTLAKLSRSLLANRQSDVLGLLSQTFAPYAPAWLWRWANRAFRQRDWDIFQYSAIRPARLEELGLEAMARERNLDFSYRPRKDSFASRLWVMRRVDQGNYNKGQLAGWGLDSRDPTFDKRLVEFCLGAPMAEFLKGGVKRSLGKRALADRLPAAVIAQKGKGLQAIDWHEGLTAARADVARELDRLEQCAPAATSLDVAKLKRLVEDWPQAGWEKDDVVSPYRLALLRGISVGHFARKAAGSNS